MVPGKNSTTADTPHPTAEVDMYVIYMESCHLPCPLNDPPATGRIRWIGLTRHSPKMPDTPSWENEDTRRTEGLRDRCLLTKVEHNRNSRKSPHISKIPSKFVHVRQYALDMAYIAPQRTYETMC